MDRGIPLFDRELKATVFGILLLCNVILWGSFALGIW